jgi:lantibiotic modifying enzyme
MTSAELTGLANRTTYLHERLARGWTPDPADHHLPLAKARLERWCHLAAGGDWDRFRQRLAWDGLDEAAALALLRPGRLAEEGDPPRWMPILAAALGEEGGTDLAAPFVSVAETFLAQAAGEKSGWLSPPARQRLTGYLADRLAIWIEPIFTQPGWKGVEIQTSPHPLYSLVLAYPVLARQLATRAMHWVDEVADFLARLAADWPALAARLALPAQPEVAALRPGLSDPHQRGRTVWQVTFAHGPSVAYKPKDLSLDRAWADLVDWANRQGLTHGPGSLWVLPRPGYGWMEWAETHAPRTTHHDDPSPMARRMGGLLALLHLLHAADCHADNLAVRAGLPLLLDGEMLAYPQFAGQEGDDPLDVMRTGLLPRWRITSTGVTVEGITDELGAALHHGAVAEGYQAAQTFLAHHWPTLSRTDGPLAPFRRGQVRVAPRPTAAYLRLGDHLRHPAFLSDGVDFSLEMERLAATYLHRPDRLHLSPLLAGERQAVAQADVPIFSARIGEPDLNGEGCSVPDCLTWPPFTLADAITQAQQQGLIRESLDATALTADDTDDADGAGKSLGYLGYLRLDKESSLAFLEVARFLGDLLMRRAVPSRSSTSWRSRTSVTTQPPPGGGQEKSLNAPGSGPPPGGSFSTPEQLRTSEIHADPTNPGHPRPLSWLAPQFQHKSGLYQHGLVGDDLYAGRAGIALFLAGLYRVTREGKWRDLALAGLAAADEAPIDAGGHIYAFSLAGMWLDAPDLLVQAQALAKQGGDVAPAGLLDGQAGMILGLLALHRCTEAEGALAQAIRWGDGLLAGEGAWQHPQRGLGGFSHGAAGIAHALGRLYRVSSEARFREVAARAWSFQQRFFDEGVGNWQDRRGVEPVYLGNWCNGAAGIGLAAAHGLTILPGAEAAAQRAADLLTQGAEPPFLDTLCCGDFGQIDCLLEMGHLLGRQDWIDQATRQARQALDRAIAAGHFQLYDDLPPHLLNPGFFRGVAGIGYTLLRLSTAGKGRMLPSVLGVEV